MCELTIIMQTFGLIKMNPKKNWLSLTPMSVLTS